MTVSTTINKASGTGDGQTHIFTYNFKIFADTDLQVVVRSATGVETTQVLNTDYVVTGANSDTGGSVLFKFNTGNTSDPNYATTEHRPQTGETVTITRIVPLTQVTDYVANDPFPADAHETALDRLTFIVQQIQEEVDRCIKASPTNAINSTAFTIGATARADRLFGFDANGELTVSTAAADVANAQQNASTATTKAGEASASAADAEKLAINPHNSQFTLSDGVTTGFSALHYNTEVQNTFQATNFPTLSSTYVGYYLRVNATFDGYEFVVPPTDNAIFYGIRKSAAGAADFGMLKQDNTTIGSSDAFDIDDYSTYFFGSGGQSFSINANGHLLISTP
tara:strand:- start:3196 stop:4212 length:1017 start_codon:yes stop_codon:yes gene_type:complete